MKAVILAGGNGTRMGVLTYELPKPIVKIGDRPILWHIMKIYSSFGIKDFIIATGYKHEKINNYFLNTRGRSSDVSNNQKDQLIEINDYSDEGWSIKLAYTGEDTKTGGRIKRIRNIVGDETFCLTYGDGVSDINLEKLIEFHEKQNALATVSVIHPPEKFGIIEFNGDMTKVHKYLEKPTRSDWINGGFFVLEPEVIELIKDDKTVWEKEPLTHLANVGQLSAYKHYGFWQCMDTPKDHKKLLKSWESNNAEWKIW